MKKIHKSVLRSSLVMLSLLALTVVGSSVAQAQECIARTGKSVMVPRRGYYRGGGDHRLAVRGAHWEF